MIEFVRSLLPGHSKTAVFSDRLLSLLNGQRISKFSFRLIAAVRLGFLQAAFAAKRQSASDRTSAGVGTSNE